MWRLMPTPSGRDGSSCGSSWPARRISPWCCSPSSSRRPMIGFQLTGPLVGLFFGTAIGLTLAQWFAFRMAADLTALDETDLWAAGKEALAQIAGGH